MDDLQHKIAVAIVLAATGSRVSQEALIKYMSHPHYGPAPKKAARDVLNIIANWFEQLAITDENSEYNRVAELIRKQRKE